jgi:agmatinase
VLFPSPGGLTFGQVTDLMQGLAQKGPLGGLGLFEIRPGLDVNGVTALTGAHLVAKFIGTLARSGRFKASTDV